MLVPNPLSVCREDFAHSPGQQAPCAQVGYVTNSQGLVWYCAARGYVVAGALLLSLFWQQVSMLQRSRTQAHRTAIECLHKVC